MCTEKMATDLVRYARAAAPVGSNRIVRDNALARTPIGRLGVPRDVAELAYQSRHGGEEQSGNQFQADGLECSRRIAAGLGVTQLQGDGPEGRTPDQGGNCK